MNPRGGYPEAKVGLFVVTALAILSGGALWIAGSSLLTGSRNRYEVVMVDSGGLKAGDSVRVAGVPVGRVQYVRLAAPGDLPVALDVTIDADVVIRSDATARTATTGLMGAPFLHVEPGATASPPLPPGGRIRGIETPTLAQVMDRMDALSVQAMQLLDSTARTLDQVSGEIGPLLARLELFLSEENAESVRELLTSTGALIERSSPRIDDLLVRLDGIAARVDAGLEEVPGLTARIADLTSDLRSAIGPDGSRLSRVLDATGATLSLVESHGTEIESAISDLSAAAGNLKALSQQLKERPFSLVRIKPEPDRRPGDGARESKR